MFVQSNLLPNKRYATVIHMILLIVQVKNVIEKPHNDHLPLIEASRFTYFLYFITCIEKQYEYASTIWRVLDQS